MGDKNCSQYHGQIEEFFSRIRQLGFSDGDFTVRCLQWPFTAKPSSAISDLIIVKRTSNEFEMAYAADTSTTWMLSFLEDLNNGVFDTIEEPAERPPVVKLVSESESQT